MHKITFILPILKKDINLFLNIQLPSISNNININFLDKFILFTSDKDIDSINNIINTLKNNNEFKNIINKIEILNENLLIPKNWGKDGYGWNNTPGFEGWWKQQLIKLFSYKYTNTDYYIVLDADVILLKKLDYDKLFINNKPILGINHSSQSFHHDWIKYSCDTFFKEDIDKINNIKGNNIMGVTPQILIKKVSNNILNYLIKKYNGIDNLLIYMNKTKWNSSENRLGWTEFGIYWSYIVINNNIDLYYNNENLLTSLQLVDENIRKLDIKCANKNWCGKIEDLFQNNNFLFGVFQSNIKCPINKQIKILKHYCNNFNYINEYIDYTQI